VIGSFVLIAGVALFVGNITGLFPTVALADFVVMTIRQAPRKLERLRAAYAAGGYPGI
jgi:hypothetical protein